MTSKFTQAFRSGRRTISCSLLLGAWSVLFITSSSLGIDFSASGSCTVTGYTVGAHATLDVSGPNTIICACVCDGPGNCLECTQNGTCNDPIARVTLMRGAVTCTGSAGITKHVLCGDAGTPACVTPFTDSNVSLTQFEKCAMAFEELQIVIETQNGKSFLLDYSWGKPEPILVPAYCTPVPAASEWGLASLVLLTMIVGTVAIRQRAC